MVEAEPKSLVLILLMSLPLQTSTSVKMTTTTGAASMTALTSLGTTGAPALMASCWLMMDTTAWVSGEAEPYL